MKFYGIEMAGETASGVNQEEMSYLNGVTSNIQVQFDTLSGGDSGHGANTNNPHQVTKTQVGLGNVPDTDFSGDVASNNAHRIATDNPHSVTKTQVGLGNVPNLDFSNASNITTGTLPSAVLPPIAITSTYTAGNEAAQLALTTQEGDVVVRTDESRSYIHNGGSAGTMADFTELQTPTDTVLSVNGETGSVILNQDEVLDGATYVRTHEDFTSALLSKLNGIEASADVNMTANELLTAIKTVDGSGSGLDADFLDGYNSSAANDVNTVVRRDASGNFAANVITATVTQSNYADLAEKYTCADEALETGTLVSACTEGEYEAQECVIEKASNVIGIVSDKAGYIMNQDLTNSVIVGLTGKVPVKVVGKVQKGQPIISAGAGCARQAYGELELVYKIGIALESNDQLSEKLVYCAIK